MVPRSRLGARCQSRVAAGFSLVEALVAFVVFSIGALAVVSLFAAALQEAGDVKRRSAAVNLAEQALEQVRAGVVSTSAFDALVGSSVSITGRDAVYSLTTVVTSQSAPERKVVAAEVAWTDGKGVIQRVELQTQVAPVEIKAGGEWLLGLRHATYGNDPLP